jgi:predicted transcriptional regulator
MNTNVQIAADKARHLRNMAAMGGLVTAAYFDGVTEHKPVRKALVTAGLIERVDRGRVRAYQLTDAGEAWLDEHGRAA